MKPPDASAARTAVRLGFSGISTAIILLNKSARSFVEQLVLSPLEVAPKSVVVGHPIHTVAELRQQIREDLRKQHPEWIEPGGGSPMCDFYEARLTRLLETCGRSEAA